MSSWLFDFGDFLNFLFGELRFSGKDFGGVLYQSIYMREAVPLIPYVVSRAEKGDFSFALNMAARLGTVPHFAKPNRLCPGQWAWRRPITGQCGPDPAHVAR